jgi:predicted patatin/cPLA2 family phospholipase
MSELERAIMTNAPRAAVLAGTHPRRVIDLILERASATGRTQPDPSRKLGLVIEGGGMRGVISAGSLLALDLLGFRQIFDEIYAASAGGVNAAYFLSGQGKLGMTVYFDDIANRRFINPWRVFKIVDVDYAYDRIISLYKPLDDAAIRASRVRFLLSVTDARSGLNELLDVRARSEPVPLLLKASSALPVLYNRRVVLDGREFVDGGVSDSLPVARAIENGCTDILVLASSRCDAPMARPGLGERSLFYVMMGRRYPALMRAFASMHEALNRGRRLATGEEAVDGVNVALIAPYEGDSTVGSTAIERTRLVRGAHLMATRTFELFAGERAILDALFETYRARPSAEPARRGFS